jgi:beta-lactamase regulating signal transducer with metallopeptidase domain
MQGLAVQFADALLTFALQAAAAWLLCKCCVRLLRRPQHRFVAWLLFLMATGVYWIWLMAGLGLEILRPATTLGTFLSNGASTHGRFLLPSAWLLWLQRLIAAAFLAYVACLAWLTGRLAWRSFTLRSLLKLASPPSPRLHGIFEQLCSESGISRTELLLLTDLHSPATVYWWKPRVLVPENFNELGASDRVADVLRHELAHVARRDYLLSGLSDAICTLLLFHPAAWSARKQMRLERELACDLAVVEACPDRRADYADTLAHFVRQRMLYQSAACGIDFAESAPFLLHRVRCILADPVKTPWWKRLSAAGAGFAMFTLFTAYAPALAIVLDFASQPVAAASRVLEPRAEADPVHKSKTRPAKAVPAATREAVSFPDDLTKLRVHDRRIETEEFQPAARGAGDTVSGGPDLTRAAWREQSPATPRIPAPSARSILLGTIAGTVYSERKEHTTHGHGK